MSNSSHSDNLDPGWLRISRFRPEISEEGLTELLELLKHPEWIVRFNAARELYFLADERALDALVDLLKNDPSDNVRRMAAQALGALAEKGIAIPGFEDTLSPDKATQMKVARARLKELKVQISVTKDGYHLLIPHKLLSPEYIEIGFLIAQLAELPFPAAYSPLCEVPSKVILSKKDVSVEFHESYPHGLSYRIYRTVKKNQNKKDGK